MKLSTFVCFLVTLTSFALSSNFTDKLKSTQTDPATRAEQTLEGLFNYYWKSDPLDKKIKFLFVCGQVGGWGEPHSEGECSCDNRTACVNCYRWFDATTLESVATYGIYMNTKNHSTVPDIIFNHSPYNGEWNAHAICTFIDDFSWYGIAYLRVYEWLKDPKWLNRSLAIYDWVWKYGWDEPCGGFWWTNCDDQMFKDSITIVEVLHFASKLSYMFSDESRYLIDATKIWDWFFSFDDGHGLMSDKYLVSTGAIPEKCCNSTSNLNMRCYNSKISGTSYNQGLLMSASAYLYLRTGNKTYLMVGLRALEAILVNYTTSQGILIDEPRTYQSFVGSCWGGADPGGDWYSFNGIFMLHLGYFTEVLVKNKSLSPEVLEKIKNLVNKTSDSAWSHSAVWPPFGYSDGCNIGVSPLNGNVHYPKFHWWWGHDNTQQMIPPDPKHFFFRKGLRCHTVGHETQLWEGMIESELKCKHKCDLYANCSKYLYQTDQSSVSGLDCWLWSYNRSDHSCSQIQSNFNLGIKRPIGTVTCAGKCGSKEPQKLEHGVCYCDSDCAKHLDCCLDYANYCRPNKPISCKGLCAKFDPQPIPGGGYCWCFDGCNGWFTDNNSDASCCQDYPQECMNVVMPVCLDGRTQGSALNLFLTHYTLTKIKSVNNA